MEWTLRSHAERSHEAYSHVALFHKNYLSDSLNDPKRIYDDEPSISDAMIRRSKLEVFMDIMKVVAEEREMRRTRIMYKANLAWKVLNEALDSMERRGILVSQETPSGVFVRLTPSGKETLDRFCQVESVFVERTNAAIQVMYPTTKMTALR